MMLHAHELAAMIDQVITRPMVARLVDERRSTPMPAQRGPRSKPALRDAPVMNRAHTPAEIEAWWLNR